MHFTSLLAGAFALGALAAPNGNIPSSSRCYTQQATTRPRQSPTTSWSTSYSPCTSTSLVTVTTTSIPSAITSTISSTVSVTTTAPTSTLTATTTNSVTVTTTSTQSVTVITTTTTTTSSVSTAAAGPTGFLPVQSTLPGSSYRGAGGSINSKRDAQPEDLAVANVEERTPQRGGSSGHSPWGSQSMYPQQYNCIAYTSSTKCSTVTSTLTSTVIGSAPTVSTTTTISLTSTVYPSATTTTTAITTVTATQQTVTTLTQTATATFTSVATSTYYPACNDQTNYADTINGAYIEGVTDNDSAYQFSSTTTSGAYTCCVAMLQNGISNPANMLFIPAGYGSNNCFMYNANSCSAGQSSTSKESFYNSGTTAAYAWVITQFQCGEYANEAAG